MLIPLGIAGGFRAVLLARPAEDRGEREHGDHVPLDADAQVLCGADYSAPLLTLMCTIHRVFLPKSAPGQMSLSKSVFPEAVCPRADDVTQCADR